MLIYACQANLYSLVLHLCSGCVRSLHLMYTWLARLNVVFRGSGASLSVLPNMLRCLLLWLIFVYSLEPYLFNRVELVISLFRV